MAIVVFLMSVMPQLVAFEAEEESLDRYQSVKLLGT
jgi:hypothetical protein